MILTTDGRGEFILLAETGGVYEEFATSQDLFTTVSSSNPQTTGQGTWDMTFAYWKPGAWPTAQAQQRVLVKSAYVYGKDRHIRDLKIDVQNSYGPIVERNGGGAHTYVRIRPITGEFDPATVTWEWAYTQGNLQLADDPATQLLLTASGNTAGSPLPSRRNVPLYAWNVLDEIHGFELRVEPMGLEPDSLYVIWQADLAHISKPVAYVVLE